MHASTSKSLLKHRQTQKWTYETVMKMMTQIMDTGLRRAVKKEGGVRPLARKLGLSHVAVMKWDAVPLDRLVLVETKTGIPREDLRPEFFRVVIKRAFSASRSSKRKLLTAVT